MASATLQLQFMALAARRGTGGASRTLSTPAVVRLQIVVLENTDYIGCGGLHRSGCNEPQVQTAAGLRRGAADNVRMNDRSD
jgi:hypothetical protein